MNKFDIFSEEPFKHILIIKKVFVWHGSKLVVKSRLDQAFVLVYLALTK